MAIYKKNINNIFYIFIASHLLIWTLIPTFTNHNLPLDTIEALAWGSNLDWGFNKHPPMSAFLPEIIYFIFGPQDWAYYLLSQICIVVSFFVIFKLAEDFFENKIYCLLSVLLLEGIYFYNFTTPEFNVNVCLIPFWSLSLFYLWKGIRNNKILDWIFLGLFAGLGFLSKYLFVYLGLAIAVLLIYLIINKKINLKCLVSLIPFLIILSPHIIWLSENDYVTITYGLMRTGLEGSNFIDHVKYPIIFLLKQIGLLIPFFVLILLLVKKIKFKINFKDKKLIFLIFINFLPIFLMLVTSIITGSKIRTMWMTPFYLFFGVLFVYLFKSQINIKKLNYFLYGFLFLFFLSPILYSYISISQTNKRTDYSGKEIATLIERRWSKNFSNKIMYVVGDEWHAGNLSYHLSSRPIWFKSIKGKIEKLDPNGGIIYTGNSDVLKEVCPGDFGKINKQGFCMIGLKK